MLWYVSKMANKERSQYIVYSQESRTSRLFRRTVVQLYNAHCSYLDIYISQKIRLCVVDLEDKSQTNLQAKLLNFLVWKFKSVILIFFYFLQKLLNSVLFAHCAILWWSIHVSHIFASNRNSNISTLCNSSDRLQKALDLTNPAKNRRKLRITDLNFQTKKLRSLAHRLVWNLPSKSTSNSLIFREM